MPATPRVLFVDDDQALLATWQRAFARDPMSCVFADGFEAALSAFEGGPVDVILCDERFPNRSGWELLETVRASSPRTMRLMITGAASATSAVAGINRGGIYRLLLKPTPVDAVREAIQEAIAHQRLRDGLWRALTQLQRVTQALELVAVRDPEAYRAAVAAAAAAEQATPVHSTSQELVQALDQDLADLDRTVPTP